MFGKEMREVANSPHCRTEENGGVWEGRSWLMNCPPALVSNVTAVFVGRLPDTEHSKRGDGGKFPFLFFSKAMRCDVSFHQIPVLSG